MLAPEQFLPGMQGRISLARIDAIVSCRLGPTRIRSNARPAVFNRQVAMYRKTHGRLSCLASFVCGLVCLVVVRRLDWVVPEVLSTGLGAALIVGAHALNVRFSSRCPCCRAEAEQKVTHS
jgi:hypothetical protein